MIDRINQGDKQALKDLLTLYTKPIFNRALHSSGNDATAKAVTRATLSDIMQAAERGVCPSDVEPWIMQLVDRHSAQEYDVRKIADARLSDATEPEFPYNWAPPERQSSWTPPEISTPAAAQQPQPRKKPVTESNPRRTQITPVRAQEQPAPTRGVAASRSTDLFEDTDDEDIFEDEEDEDAHKGGIGMVLLIMALVLVVAGLAWILVVMMMTRGILPMADMGFASWFNTHLFKLY
ncbi:MAG: hypothetical protein RR232_04930 [Clostridia bacterium]